MDLTPPERDAEDIALAEDGGLHEDKCLKFDLEELGDQFGVRAGELVRALEARHEEHARPCTEVEGFLAGDAISPETGAAAELPYAGEGLVLTFVAPEQPVEHRKLKTHLFPCLMATLRLVLTSVSVCLPDEEPLSLGERLSEILNAGPTLVETSMTGSSLPFSTIVDDMQVHWAALNSAWINSINCC
jgi:hypothetical protein